MADYDAIVCGGGPNGLAAAIRLAEAGWSVCLFEANDDVGGAARTLECTVPGFRHDFGAAFFPLVGAAPSVVGRDLAPYGLRFVHAPLPAAHPFPGNRAIALGRSAAETGASIDKVHLGDGAVWISLDEAFGEAMAPFLRAQMQRWPFEELVEVMRRLGVAGGLEFARVVVQGVSAVCALDVGTLVRLTGPDAFPPRALAEIRGYRPGLGTFKVDWALDGQVPWAAEECRRAAVVHVGDTATAMSRSAWEAGHGLLPAQPTLILGQQSLADPSRAPAGKHTLWGYAHVPAVPTGDAARPRAKGNWGRSAEVFLDRVEAVIEAHAPGFRDLVLGRKVWTPDDLQTADASLVGGDIQAGSFAIDQQILFPPGPGRRRPSPHARGRRRHRRRPRGRPARRPPFPPPLTSQVSVPPRSGCRPPRSLCFPRAFVLTNVELWL